MQQRAVSYEIRLARRECPSGRSEQSFCFTVTNFLSGAITLTRPLHTIASMACWTPLPDPLGTTRSELQAANDDLSAVHAVARPFIETSSMVTTGPL